MFFRLLSKNVLRNKKMSVPNTRNKDDEINELQQSMSSLSEIIKHLEKNPSTMREAFFIEVISAYHEIDESIKKRAIGLNTRLLAVNKSIDQLKNIDVAIQNKVLQSLDGKLNAVVDNFAKNLSSLEKPIQETNRDFKTVGKAFVKLENQIDTKLQKLIEISEQNQKANEKITGLKTIIPVLIGTNIAMLVVLCIQLFLK